MDSPSNDFQNISKQENGQIDLTQQLIDCNLRNMMNVRLLVKECFQLLKRINFNLFNYVLISTTFLIRCKIRMYQN